MENHYCESCYNTWQERLHDKRACMTRETACNIDEYSMHTGEYMHDCASNSQEYAHFLWTKFIALHGGLSGDYVQYFTIRLVMHCHYKSAAGIFYFIFFVVVIYCRPNEKDGVWLSLWGSALLTEEETWDTTGEVNRWLSGCGQWGIFGSALCSVQALWVLLEY